MHSRLFFVSFGRRSLAMVLYHSSVATWTPSVTFRRTHSECRRHCPFPFRFTILFWRSWYSWESGSGLREFLNDQPPVHAESQRQCSLASQKILSSLNDVYATITEIIGKRTSFCGCGEVCALAECVPFCPTQACFEETGHFDTELDPSLLLAPNASIAQTCCTDRLAQRA